jgi:hypothetical protein
MSLERASVRRTRVIALALIPLAAISYGAAVLLWFAVSAAALGWSDYSSLVAIRRPTRAQDGRRRPRARCGPTSARVEATAQLDGRSPYGSMPSLAISSRRFVA